MITPLLRYLPESLDLLFEPSGLYVFFRVMTTVQTGGCSHQPPGC